MHRRPPSHPRTHLRYRVILALALTGTTASMLPPTAQARNELFSSGIMPAATAHSRAVSLPRYRYRPGEELDYQLTVHYKSFQLDKCNCSGTEGSQGGPVFIKIRSLDTHGVAQGVVSFDTSFAWLGGTLRGHPSVAAQFWPRGRITGPTSRFFGEVGGQGIWNLPAGRLHAGLQWVSHATGHFSALAFFLYHVGLPLPTVIRHTFLGNRPASSGNGTDAVFALTGVVTGAADVPNLPGGHDSVSGSTRGEVRFNLTHGVLDTARVHESMDLTRTHTTSDGTRMSLAERNIFDFELKLLYGRIPH